MEEQVTDATLARLWGLAADALVRETNLITIPEDDLAALLPHLDLTWSETIGEVPKLARIKFGGFEVVVTDRRGPRSGTLCIVSKPALSPHLAVKIVARAESARRDGWTQPVDLKLTTPELHELADLVRRIT
jgi:hypothetical protein